MFIVLVHNISNSDNLNSLRNVKRTTIQKTMHIKKIYINKCFGLTDIYKPFLFLQYYKDFFFNMAKTSFKIQLFSNY